MDSNNEYYGAGRPGEGLRRFARRTVLIPLAGILVLAIGVWVVFGIIRGSGQKETALDAAIKASDNAFQAGDYQKSLDELKKRPTKQGAQKRRLSCIRIWPWLRQALVR